MIQIIAGLKGSGKTKKILDTANEASQNPSNVVVFVDTDNKHMCDLKHEVRLVSADEFGVGCQHMLLGFIAGMISQNFDINLICIDGFKKLIHATLAETETFFEKLTLLSEKYNVKFVITVSEDVAVLPEHIKKYL